MTSKHSAFMRRALELAAKGRHRTHPNPCVGAVIVKNARIIAEGYHQVYGGPHAEVSALIKAGKNARGATMYVTLEPCSHWGKTPPCAPLLVEKGLRAVYVAMKDPNPLVSGQGLNLLKRAKINVHVGLEEATARELNPAFVTRMTKKRPYIIIKAAMSLDGKIATSTGDSRWISSPAARSMVHQLRAESDAILVGATTATHDNPNLTSHGAGPNPIRIILDPHLRCPLSLNVFNDGLAKTVVITTKNASITKVRALEKRNVSILRLGLKYGSIDIKDMLNKLTKINVSQLLIEGGGDTIWPFVSSKLIDEVRLFVAPIIIGGRNAVPMVGGAGFHRIKDVLKLTDLRVGRIGPDLLIQAKAGTGR